MQKSFVAIALALTLTSAFAAFSTQNYVKVPQSVAADNETNYTSVNIIGKSSLVLASITAGGVYLVNPNVTVNTGNASANNWNVFFKQLDTKSLTVGASNNASFTSPTDNSLTLYGNNYVVNIVTEKDNNGVFQLTAYQFPLNGGAALGKITLTTNNDTNFKVNYINSIMISKTVYFFYQAAVNRVNVTNFAIGGNVGTLEFTLTTASNPSSKPKSDILTVAWGESLSSSQVFVAWTENGVLKDAVVDVSKGTFTPAQVGAYDGNFTCRAYATDKKWYGELCTNETNDTLTYYVSLRTTGSNLAILANYSESTSDFVDSYAYGPYLAIIYRNTTNAPTNSTFSYEIWNLDTWSLSKSRTQFLTIDDASTWTRYKVPSGGLYTLLYNKSQQTNGTFGTISSVQVGLLLGSSYLASVLGFLLTIIAGLFLF